MGSYENMKKALTPIKLYNLHYGSGLYGELSAYSEGFGLSEVLIDRILRECVIPTAQSEGLSFYEKLFGAERDNLDSEKRRELLIYMINLNSNDNTVEGVKRFFRSIDFECNILEKPTVFDLYITPTGGTYSQKRRSYIIARAKEFLPCHLTFTIDFRTSTWADYDSKDLTFAQIDSKGLTWEQFEARNA